MVGLRGTTLTEDSAEVEVLTAEAKKHAELSKKLKACLARIEESGGILKDAIGPVYSNTQPLQVVNKNVDNILAAIEQQQKPLEGKAEEERIIREGPASVGVENYVASLKRIEQKYVQLNATNLRVNQEAANELRQLMVYGAKRIQDLFESLIHEDVKPVEPLHFITKQLPFPSIPPNKISELSALDAFISGNESRSAGFSSKTSTTIRIYSDVRSTYLNISLQNLASASISTSRKKSADEIYRTGTSGIGTYANGIEGIFVAEWQNITSVFSRSDCAVIFEMTTRKAIAEFSKTIRELNSQVKANPTTDCFLAYEIVGIVNRLAGRLDENTGQLKQQLTDAVKPIRDTAKASIPELLEDTKRRASSMFTLPLDGASIPLTTEIMTRLQMMVTYQRPLSSILAALGDGNWSWQSEMKFTTLSGTTKPPDVGVDGARILAHYILDSIDALLSGLEAKSRIILKSKALFGVFMANNVAVVDRMIRSSELQNLFTSTNSMSKVESWRKKGTSAYLDAWREPCAALMDVQYTNRGARPPSGSVNIDSSVVIKGLNSKDKDAIKEKFKSFNISFDGLSAKHKEMAPSMEREVRTQLGREIQAMIEPLYARFWDRYHEIDKGKGKYVRYDKAALTSQLSSMI